MTTWDEALEITQPLIDWTFRDGYIIWSNPDSNYLALVFPKVPENTLDPKLAQVNKKIEGDVDFAFDINDSSAIFEFLNAWKSLFPDDDIEIDSVPREYIYPVSYDWTKDHRQAHAKTKISKTSLSRWWGQDISRLVDTGITLTDLFEGDRDGVLYRMREERYGLNKDIDNVSCVFCLDDSPSYLGVHKLPSVNEQYHGKDYYLLSCVHCDIVIDSIEKKKIDMFKDLIWRGEE